ncbi:DUF1697 domain-containing protein [Zobellia sp. 1_MG-2023]|uniref:DUF1697 domain-containing protein n=1 Tax=Zobellia sp. 1_MG-2023 TaxID=3062626 RepID=UPI0026E1A943|nr:DUF1697 domain-containing protein [Zobellia sp. 1_MG-2023]MDO6817710.1 DUF1697 domain-containing protein [Zobellia sp. 1_MG-2023]
MSVYIALLRGINVSGQKKVPMAALRSMLTEMGFLNVKTYIQSGNVVFESEEVSTATLEVSIAENIKRTFGFDVPVLVKSRSDFRDIFNSNPYTDLDAIARKQVYFVLLKNLPEQGLVDAFSTETYAQEEFAITCYCVYLWCKTGYGKAKLNNNLVERKLKVEATTRNYNTMVKLLEMSS